MGRTIVRTKPPATLVAGVLVAGLVVAFAGRAPASDAQPEPTFHAANTITLAPKPGGTVGGTLFNVGIVRVSGRCSLPKTDPGSISVSMFLTNTGPRPVLLASGDQENSQVLAPGEGEVIAIHGAFPEWRGGTSGNVGIFDDGGVSATLLGAGSGNPATGRCIFTAQAAG